MQFKIIRKALVRWPGK